MSCHDRLRPAPDSGCHPSVGGLNSYRGTNENTNGLIRQYLPKGTDLSGYSQEQLDAIADEINGRPRKRLGVRSPIAVYRELLLNSSQHSTLFH